MSLKINQARTGKEFLRTQCKLFPIDSDGGKGKKYLNKQAKGVGSPNTVCLLTVGGVQSQTQAPSLFLLPGWLEPRALGP